MTRRDTIIAAVLVNSGLLIVLFASALKSGDSEQGSHLSSVAPVQPVQEKPVVLHEAVPSQVDEVDQVLKQYASPAQPAPVAAQSVEPSSMNPPPVAQNFADDLRAIALPEASTPAAVQPPLEVKPSAMASSSTDYKVKKGDVLEKIARHHHCSVDEIMKLNKLTSVNLRIGQILKIPSKTSSVAAAPTAPVTSPVTDGSIKYYIVKNGDNPWTIAVKNHMKVEDLLKLNNLDQEKARKLKPGDRLRVN